MSKNNKLPKWFNGECYTRGATVQKRFSGEECELNAMELSMYDFVMGSTIVLEMPGGYKHTSVDLLRKGLDWFRQNNSQAYMILLD